MFGQDLLNEQSSVDFGCLGSSERQIPIPDSENISRIPDFDIESQILDFENGSRISVPIPEISGILGSIADPWTHGTLYWGFSKSVPGERHETNVYG